MRRLAASTRTTRATLAPLGGCAGVEERVGVGLSASCAGHGQRRGAHGRARGECGGRSLTPGLVPREPARLPVCAERAGELGDARDVAGRGGVFGATRWAGAPRSERELRAYVDHAGRDIDVDVVPDQVETRAAPRPCTDDPRYRIGGTVTIEAWTKRYTRHAADAADCRPLRRTTHQSVGPERRQGYPDPARSSVCAC
jgi:hypothetical protein